MAFKVEIKEDRHALLKECLILIVESLIVIFMIVTLICFVDYWHPYITPIMEVFPILNVIKRIPEENPIIAEYRDLFGKIYVTTKGKNEVIRILKNAITPDLDYMPTVGHNNMTLIGLMGTGKTWACRNLIDLVNEAYPKEERHINFTNSMAYNLTNLYDVPYNMSIVDDAIELQDSYRSITSDSQKLTSKYFEIRHIIERRFHRYSNAYVATVFGFQMFKALHKRFRQANLMIFTSIFGDNEDNEALKAFLGEDPYNFLKAKTCYQSLLNAYSFNKYFVLRTPYDTYFAEFDPPKSQMEMLKLEPEVKGRHLDSEIIQALENNKMGKELIYNFFTFIYSKAREKSMKQKEHPSVFERKLIHILYKNGIAMEDLRDLLHRSTDTISRWANFKFKKEEIAISAETNLKSSEA